jgi:RNA polymerase primary sigma factor
MPTKSPKVTASSGAKSTVRQRNASLRSAYVELEAMAERAEQANDLTTAAALRGRMREIGDTFVAANHNLVGPLARPFRTESSRSHWADYDSAGLYGLWEAFLKWDPEATFLDAKTGQVKPVTFATFSRSYISGRVQREVNALERSTKYHDFAATSQLERIATAFADEHGRTPTDAELAEVATTKLGRTVTLAQVARIRAQRPVSLDAPVGEDGASLGDFVADQLIESVEEAESDELDHGRLVSALRALDPAELFMLAQRTRLAGCEEQTLVELASMTGIGRETVGRMFRSALDRVTAVLSGTTSLDDELASDPPASDAPVVGALRSDDTAEQAAPCEESRFAEGVLF